MSSVLSQLQSMLDEARVRHSVVGASLAILHRGDVHVAASGVLNADTRVEATPESVFQIGSIGKLFTATLVMQLVDDGRLDLDVPVKAYLPEFELVDGDATSRITTRQLLCHTSGMDGDFFPSEKDGGASSKEYLAKLARVPQLHAPGRYMAYCNSGYVVAGRIVEAMRGKSWAELVMERICRPLQMQRAFADPREALRFRVAIGHIVDPGNPANPKLSPMAYLPAGIAAAGSLLSMSAADLLRFAQAHMSDGAITGSEAPLLSVSSARAMCKEQAVLLPHSRRYYSHMGLGWFIAESTAGQIIGHDGSTSGQMAYLHCVPAKGFALALLTNSPSAELADEIKQRCFAELAGVSLSDESSPTPIEFDAARYVGTYENVAVRMEVSSQDGQLSFKALPKNPAGLAMQAKLKSHSPDCFDIDGPDPRLKAKLLFVGSADGHPAYARVGMRMARRAS